MPDIKPDTLALIAGTIAAALVVQPPPAPPVATTNGTVDLPRTDPIPVNPPTVDADPGLVAIAHKSVLLARLIATEVTSTEPVDVPAPLPWGRETRLPT